MSNITSHVNSFTLTEDQLKFYDENGFLKIEKVWNEEEVSILKKDLDDFANGHFTNKLDAHYYGNLKKIHCNKKMCDIGDSILRSRAIPIGSIAFYCKPNNPLELGSTWHQDNYAGRSPDGNNYLNLAVSLDDADETNGALLVVPGSHKWGDMPCAPKANFAKDNEGRLYTSAPIGNNIIMPEDANIVQLEYNSGDVLVVNGLLVHKANKNTHATRWRRTMYFVYTKEGEPFWPGWTAKRCLLDRYDSPNYEER
jgi:ectoine hydroxylase-related dioxygenase (phytanoyl-CoA dioxygenase family)